MSFDVRIIFSGLCAFVPNQGDETTQGRPTRGQMLLVDARQPKTALDNVELTPHFPRLFLKAEQLVSTTPLLPGTEVVLPLDRKEVRFLIPYSAEPNNRFALVDGELNPDLTPVREVDFKWGLDMKDFWPELAEVNPACFDDAGSAGLVASRVVVDYGQLSSYKLRGSPVWSFRSSIKRMFSSRAAVDLNGLDHFILLIRDLDTGVINSFPLASPNGELVEIKVTNLCNSCRPRILENISEPLPAQDEDFRWYYEICANRELLESDEMKVQLGEPGGLPVPVRDEEGDGKGDGAAKCMRVTFDSSPYA